MTSSHPFRRVLAAASVVAVVITLAGCTQGTTPPTGPSPSGQASEDATPESNGSLPPTELTFAAGADLVPGEWVPQWGDSFVGDDAFTVASADDGQGNWSYIQTATQCEISFSQGALGGIDTSAGDSEISDELLARFLGTTSAEVTPHTSDDTLPQALSETATVEVRTVAGSNPDTGMTWIMSARGFGTLDGGLLVSFVCPSGTDAVAERDAIRATHLQIVMVPEL